MAVNWLAAEGGSKSKLRLAPLSPNCHGGEMRILTSPFIFATVHETRRGKDGVGVGVGGLERSKNKKDKRMQRAQRSGEEEEERRVQVGRIGPGWLGGACGDDGFLVDGWRCCGHIWRGRCWTPVRKGAYWIPQ